MVSSRHWEQVPGTLSGLGRTEKCVVNVERVSVPGADTTDGKLDIEGVRYNMPDGDYELEYEGKVVQVRRLYGNWLSVGFS